MREEATFAAISGANDDEPPEHLGDFDHEPSIRRRSCPLRAESQEREHLGERNKPFRLVSLGRRERLPLILAVQQFLQAGIDTVGEAETLHPVRHLQLESHDMRHAASPP
jgi:hypothetical protein